MFRQVLLNVLAAIPLMPPMRESLTGFFPPGDAAHIHRYGSAGSRAG
jgi:hypothetical protein